MSSPVPTLQFPPGIADNWPMRLNERLLPVLATGILLAGAPGLIEWLVGGHKVQIDGRVHFYAVGFTALTAAAACIALSVVGARFGDLRTVIV